MGRACINAFFHFAWFAYFVVKILFNSIVHHLFSLNQSRAAAITQTVQ